MAALLEMPGQLEATFDERLAARPEEVTVAVEAMGRRLQAAYIEGAIPYLRDHEPELWAALNAVDADDSLKSVRLYESLFLEGLDRYVLAQRRRAA